jgi:hypothetical protein
MSHDTHEHHHESHNDKPVLEFKSAFYFVIILAGLFIAAIGFVKSMSHDEGGHDAHGAQHTETTHGHDGAATHKEAGNAAEPTHEGHAEAEHKEEAAPAEHH